MSTYKLTLTDATEMIAGGWSEVDSHRGARSYPNVVTRRLYVAHGRRLYRVWQGAPGVPERLVYEGDSLPNALRIYNDLE